MRSKKLGIEQQEVDIELLAKCLIARKGVAVVQSAGIDYLLTGMMSRSDLTHEERVEIANLAKSMVAGAGSFDEWAHRKNGKPSKPPQAQCLLFED